MKEKILDLIDRRIGETLDNYIRAKNAFKGKDLNQEYGSSGQKMRLILEEYDSAYKEALQMKVWFSQVR